MNKTATFLRKVPGFDDARLYRLDPPLEGERHVIVSATVVCDPETYIFAADEYGEVTSWDELPGSFRGALDHAEALLGAGYEVVR